MIDFDKIRSKVVEARPFCEDEATRCLVENWVKALVDAINEDKNAATAPMAFASNNIQPPATIAFRSQTQDYIKKIRGALEKNVYKLDVVENTRPSSISQIVMPEQVDTITVFETPKTSVRQVNSNNPIFGEQK